MLSNLTTHSLLNSLVFIIVIIALAIIITLWLILLSKRSTIKVLNETNSLMLKKFELAESIRRNFYFIDVLNLINQVNIKEPELDIILSYYRGFIEKYFFSNGENIGALINFQVKNTNKNIKDFFTVFIENIFSKYSLQDVVKAYVISLSQKMQAGSYILTPGSVCFLDYLLYSLLGHVGQESQSLRDEIERRFNTEEALIPETLGEDTRKIIRTLLEAEKVKLMQKLAI